jgi:hypothetical protein
MFSVVLAVLTVSSLESGAKILGAYYDQRPFSVDLIGAVCASLGASSSTMEHSISRCYVKVLL